ncbi:MAG: DUF1059 domain-containing protein [Desulfuromonadales bacterium]|nr:DUF1059 domain-containing protein [Desulfuromonadales bacterium]
MGRKFIDCRDYPGECTIALSADNEDELLKVVLDHGVRFHGYEDTPDLRKMLKEGFKDGTPPV